jgi:hypothetical protein
MFYARVSAGGKKEKASIGNVTDRIAELSARLVDAEELELGECSGARSSGLARSKSPRRLVSGGWRWVGECSSGETERNEEALHGRRTGWIDDSLIFTCLVDLL